jgi:hypothetical protein
VVNSRAFLMNSIDENENHMTLIALSRLLAETRAALFNNLHSLATFILQLYPMIEQSLIYVLCDDNAVHHRP